MRLQLGPGLQGHGGLVGEGDWRRTIGPAGCRRGNLVAPRRVKCKAVWTYSRGRLLRANYFLWLCSGHSHKVLDDVRS